MEVTNLMIGDWVLDGNHIAQIVLVTCDGIIGTTFNESSNVEVVEPIPLTPEILEKNGFKKQSGGSFLLEDLEDYYWVEFYPKESKYTLGVYDYIDLNWGCISIREMLIEFVHELQHLFRLCGINKEIEL